jgi:AcrR family transcriptional regulator
LIKVAGRLFSERGFDGVSVRDITSAAKANLGAVTYHFGGKESLFSEVIEKKIEPMKQMGLEIAAGNESPEVKIRKMMKVFAFHCLHKDPELRGLFVGIITARSHLPKIAVDGIRMRNRIFSAAVREGIRRGIFRKCNPETAAWHFFGMISPYILFQSLMGKCNRKGVYPRKYVDQAVEAMMDLFMNGVLVAEKSTARTGKKKRANGRQPRKSKGSK